MSDLLQNLHAAALALTGALFVASLLTTGTRGLVRIRDTERKP